MSELISPPGSVEPVFGLQIFNEDPVAVTPLPDGTVQVTSGVGESADVIFAEDPTSETSYLISTDGGADFVVTAAGDDTISAGIGDDVVFTGLGDDAVFGGVGDDRLFSGAGDDLVYGGAGNDFIRSGAGDDTIFGGAGDDNISGGAGDDMISGGAGNDKMLGGGGADLLIAGAGSDTLTGGSGADTFRFGKGANAELDKVTDFTPGEDVVELSRALLPGARLPKGDLTSNNFEVVETIGSGSSKSIVYESSTGLVYYNPGQSGSSPVPLFELGKDLNVAADSFKIIG